MNEIGDALDVEELDRDLYRSKLLWKPPAARGVFVLGHALVAASKTVDPAFIVHSLHSYFLLPGDNSRPIIYRVTRCRDGRTFATRSVNAVQNGNVIFVMTASFQKALGDEFEFQPDAPDAPDPDSTKLLNEKEFWQLLNANPNVPQKVKGLLTKRLSEPFPVEIKYCTDRRVTLKKLLNGEPVLPPRQMTWMRASGTIPDDQPMFSQCALAYASDHIFLTTALLPRGMHSLSPKLSHMATLCHSIWFHAPFKADEWMLFEMEATRVANERGLVHGKIYTRDGRHIASCSQEGVIRVRSQL